MKFEPFEIWTPKCPNLNDSGFRIPTVPIFILQAAQIEGTDINGDQAETGPSKKKNKKKNKKAVTAENDVTVETNGRVDDVVENGEAVENGDAEVDESGKAKKKRNRPKKKTKTEGVAEPKQNGVKVQTDPPTIPISELFTGTYPVGQEMEYPVAQDDLKAKNRFSSEEKRALDRSQIDMYNEIRQARFIYYNKKFHICITV